MSHDEKQQGPDPASDETAPLESGQNAAARPGGPQVSPGPLPTPGQGSATRAAPTPGLGSATRAAPTPRQGPNDDPGSPATPLPTPGQGIGPRTDDLVGQTMAGRYTVLSHLGRGGMSVVYLARHEMLKKMVAIKVLREDLATNEVSLMRFHREAMAAANIGDPHIVDVTDYGFTERGDAFIVMELLEGRSLRAALKDEGYMAVGRTVAIVRQILRALSAAHEQGIVHRDLKADNVFCTLRDGKDFIKLLDFGISKVQRPLGGTEETGLTSTGVVMGTPQYIAPEQAHGVENVDHRADLYSLGVIMYEMLTGQLPFTGRTALEILMKHIQEAPVPFRALRPDLEIPPELEQVVFKAMAKEPDERYASAQEMLEALPDPRALPGGFTSGALAVAPLLQRRRAFVLPLILGVLMLAVVGVVFVTMRGSETRLFPEAIARLDAAVPARSDTPVTLARRSAGGLPGSDLKATVTIKLQVVPARAKLYQEGRLVGQGFFHRVVQRSSPGPVLQIKAPGFRTETIQVATDQDQNMTVTLDRLSVPASKRSPGALPQPKRPSELRDNPYLKKKGG